MWKWTQLVWSAPWFPRLTAIQATEWRKDWRANRAWDGLRNRLIRLHHPITSRTLQQEGIYGKLDERQSRCILPQLYYAHNVPAVYTLCYLGSEKHAEWLSHLRKVPYRLHAECSSRQGTSSEA